MRDVGAVARAKGLQVQVFNASTIREIDAAFATLVRERTDALFIANDPFLDRPARSIGPIGSTPLDSCNTSRQRYMPKSAG